MMLLTAIGNAGLNGVLAQLLGTGLTFGRTCSAILLSFAIAATILAAFSPLILFLLLNVPTLGTSDSAYAVVLVSHVAAIALAGVVANYRLLRLIQHLCGSLGIARRTLLAWLAGNLLLGSQVAWVLRPFVGTPGAPVTFLRNDAVRGNFFEAIADSMRRLIVE
ncbi:MAG TPA: hypothetical protein VHZ24_09950 [Pirellulales bacterium]|nr:hypothetical protein [Pirellulales bacterium]